MSNRIYIQCTWRFAITGVLFYLMTLIRFKGDDIQVMANGATVADLMYFFGIQLSLLFASLSFSSICMVLQSNYPDNQAIFWLKYLAYSISGITFWRTSFQFQYYNIIPNFEIILYCITISALIIRAFHQKNLYRCNKPFP